MRFDSCRINKFKPVFFLWFFYILCLLWPKFLCYAIWFRNTPLPPLDSVSFRIFEVQIFGVKMRREAIGKQVVILLICLFNGQTCIFDILVLRTNLIGWVDSFKRWLQILILGFDNLRGYFLMIIMQGVAILGRWIRRAYDLRLIFVVLKMKIGFALKV